MNLVDRVVSAFSPEQGVKREAARQRLSAMTALNPAGLILDRGGYDGGRTDRRETRGWRARLRGPNADQGKGRDTVIARSRSAVMNMPMGTAAIERPVAFIVGSGLMAIPDIDPEAVGQSEEVVAKIGKRIATDYDEYMASTDADAERTATGYGLQEIIMRSVLGDGDVLQVRVMPDNQRGRVSATATKLIEADRVASPFGHREGERLANGNVCVFGVELDEYAAPVAFHVLKSPRDSRVGLARRANDTVRIEAWGEKTGMWSAILLMHKKRPEQARGVSILAPVIELLCQISDLTKAEAFAAVLTSMLAITYKTPGAQPFPEPIYADTTNDADRIVQGGVSGGESAPRGDYRLEAGSVLELDTDAEVDVSSPGRPNPAFDPFFQALCRQLAAATSIPFEVLNLHFTASYSASRGALEVMYLFVRRWREWLACTSEQPRYQAWLYEQVSRGRYRLPGFLNDVAKRAAWSRVRFRGDGKISLDPAREAKGFETAQAHGWRTGAEITAEMTGGDYDANIQRRGREHKAFVDAGLPIPNQNGGGTAPAPDEDTKGKE